MQLISLEQNNSSFKQTVPDPGKGPGRPRPSLLLDQTEERGRPPPLSKGLDDRPPPPPYLTVWVRPWRMRILCVLQI